MKTNFLFQASSQKLYLKCTKNIVSKEKFTIKSKMNYAKRLYEVSYYLQQDSL